MNKEDLSKYSNQELSLRIFNDECLYKSRNGDCFIETLYDIFVFTHEQLKELKKDLKEDKKELLNSEIEETIDGWIESLDDYPQNLSAKGLEKYVDNCGGFVILFSEAEEIFKLYEQVEREYESSNCWFHFYEKCKEIIA